MSEKVVGILNDKIINLLKKLHPSFISIIITTQRTLRIEQAAIAPLWSERDVERSLHQCSL